MPSTIKLSAFAWAPPFPIVPHQHCQVVLVKNTPPLNNLLRSQSTCPPPVTPLNTNETELVPIEEGMPVYSPTQ
jgi:hypothetical protein